MITYDLILKKGFAGTFLLTTKQGFVLYKPRAHTIGDAMRECEAYMSTWTSVRIRTEDQYEQEEQRDNVSPKTSGNN